ncbi:MAG TPA: NAD(P)H-dependent oxidoreductase subunit E [bacterium]|nr:NAD(P)H-dependent oxidoreductase subunit E [bacterium]
MNAGNGERGTGNGISESAKVEIRRLIAQFPQRQSALLGALFVAQDEVGHLSPEAIRDVAEAMELAESEVTSVASFYHLYQFKPAGRHLIQVCTNLSCMLMGCGRILEHLKDRLRIDVGQTTPDGRFTLKTAECLAACELAPMMHIGDDRFGPLTPEKVDEILGRVVSRTSNG